MRHGEIANSLSIWSFAATLVALFCSPLGVSAYDGIPRIAFEVEYNIDTAVLMPDGTIKLSLVNHWEVISEKE